MIGNVVYDQFLTANDWPFGAALASALIGLMIVLLLLQARAADRLSGETPLTRGGDDG
jgi:spermidine/putrescine transport system permease protein